MTKELYKNLDFVTFKKFNTNAYPYDEEHLKYFCNWMHISKTSGLGIIFWSKIRRERYIVYNIKKLQADYK